MDVENSGANYTSFGYSPLLPMLIMSLAQQRFAPKIATSFEDEYDYIVVGSGAAGSVVASRLSEIPCVSVLLLEAGKSPPIMTEVPIVGENFTDPDFYFDFNTVPQKHSGNGSIDNVLKFATGRAVGGSSVINGMGYVRGNRRNYDDWARGGAVGWSYSDVKPYFLKMEDETDPEFLQNGYHAKDGPVTVQSDRYVSELKKPLYDTAEKLGFEILDSNGPHQVGYDKVQAFQRNGQRCSSAKSYLVPAENRTNLDIVANAFVKRILIRKHKTYAVEFDFEKTTRRVKVRREVIVSAGTVNTAKLLMLSGIGPKEHLKELKIKVKADLPVGNNLQDHVGVPVPFQLNSGIPQLKDKYQDQSLIQEYIDHRTGLLSAIVAVSLIAFLNEKPSTDPEFPTFQLSFPEVRPDALKGRYNLEDEVFEKAFGPYLDKSTYLCIAQVIDPKSRGTVRLKSSNPYDDPLIDPNYFDDPHDIELIKQAMKTCHDIGDSDILKSSVGSEHLSTVPGCEKGDYECIARTITVAQYHNVGTAKMGDPKDETTVVDSRLRVKGIKGLRVADASVMPIVPSGNTYVPVVMIGEKAADMIKDTIDCHTQTPV